MITHHLPDAHFPWASSIEALEGRISSIKTRFEDLMTGWLFTFLRIDKEYLPNYAGLVISFSVFPIPQKGEKIRAVKFRFTAKGLLVSYDGKYFQSFEVDRVIRNVFVAVQEAK